MKPLHFLPPAAALAIAGVWLGTRQHSIATLEKETVLLRQHVESAKHLSADSDPSLAAARANGRKEKDDIDWKDLADTMAKAERGGMPDMRAMMKLQTKLMSLGGPELVAALDEIAALDLSKDARRSLENMLIGLLAQKEPKLVLDRFIDRINDNRDGMGSWQFAHAFQQWSGKDSAAAVAWLDAQIAAGKFESKSLDGKSQSRLQFEAAVVGSLLKSDPDAAGKRIAGLPEDQRRELFQQGFMDVKPGSEKAFAALIREHVPENEQGQALANVTGRMIHQGGYEKVGEFLDEIEASPSERKEVAKSAATSKFQQLSHQGGVDRKAVDDMREWVARESPEAVDTITGESLGNLWGRQSKWEDNAKLVTELHSEKPGDDLLVSFLQGHQARQHREAALEMAAKIADETRRAEVIAQLEGKPVRTTVIAE